MNTHASVHSQTALSPRARVLIVEDQPVEQLRLASMVKKMGYATTCASNGKEALELIDSEGVDIIISDWKMPVMDGLSLCRNIRKRPGLEYPYFILLTGCDSRPDLIAGMDAGADDFITKPFNNEELRVRLDAGYRIEQLKAQLDSKSEHLAQTNKALEQTQIEMQSDLQSAALMQRELLPANYQLFENWNADALFWPVASVSGDMFNLFKINRHLLGFYHVDVSGHGVAAAMMSFTLSRLLGTSSGSIDESLKIKRFDQASPAHIVDQLNRRFQTDQLHTPFFTMIYGVIDTENHRGKLCQAGHPHPMIINQLGEVRKIGEGGFPVGCLDDAHYADTEFSLKTSERLITYSDGVTECHNTNKEQFSEARLTGILRNTQQKSVNDIMYLLEDALHRWSGQSPQEDDITALLIEHTAWDTAS